VLTYFTSQIAFLKMFATQTAQLTAADAVQIFGGRGITRTGMGKFIEHVRFRTSFGSAFFLKKKSIFNSTIVLCLSMPFLVEVRISFLDFFVVR
jgi:hypothetical protein